jgi:hypothetical protein
MCLIFRLSGTRLRISFGLLSSSIDFLYVGKSRYPSEPKANQRDRYRDPAAKIHPT